MKAHWVKDTLNYDGSQLRSLFSYLNYKILGDSILGFAGSCDIQPDKMVDGEDLLANSEIAAEKMLHFIVEKFDVELFSAVCLQRLMSDHCIQLIKEMAPKEIMSQGLVRKGDDIFFENRKLNISIATVSPASTLIHYGINIENKGTPVETLSLSDFKIDHIDFADKFMTNIINEIKSIQKATQKVKWVN
jgi:hypothetical protein